MQKFNHWKNIELVINFIIFYNLWILISGLPLAWIVLIKLIVVCSRIDISFKKNKNYKNYKKNIICKKCTYSRK